MDVDRILRLIAARIPELEGDMPEIADRLQARPVVMLDDVLANRILEVIERMSERLDGFERIVVGEAALTQPPTSWQ